MCIKEISTRQRGLTLIELVMFIVIVSVAVVGVLQVLNLTTRYSADPQLRKQALAIAEGLLEEVELARFTYCDPSDANAESATSTADCAIKENLGPDAGETRPFDNVNDYWLAVPVSYTTDAAGNSFPAGYAATVSIVPAALGPAGVLQIAAYATPQNMNVLRITVSVTYDNNNSIVLDGYRTRYAPNAVP